MAKLSLWKKADIILLVCAATAIGAPAQTFTSLYSFNQPGSVNPAARLIQGTDGNFYGTTEVGGTYGIGTVFKVTPDGTQTTLYNFNGGDGAVPWAGLIQGTDGNFYGTTSQHGPNDHGTIFRITPDGRLTTLYSFNGTDGDLPWAELIQATNGDFYGTTWQGGTYNGGTIFKITSASTLTVLYNFCALDHCPDGTGPKALIQATDGNFYGTTVGGGAFGGVGRAGTVFKMTPAGIVTTLYSFCSLLNCTDGKGPSGALTEGTDGNLYGTTSAGGAYYTKCPSSGCGTIFQLTPAGILTTLHSFCALAACPDGSGPYRPTDSSHRRELLRHSCTGRYEYQMFLQMWHDLRSHPRGDISHTA